MKCKIALGVFLALSAMGAARPARAQTPSPPAAAALNSQIDAVANAYHDEDADKAAHDKKAESQADEQTDMALEQQRIQLGEQRVQLQEDQTAADRENEIITHALKQQDAGTNVLNAKAGAITKIGNAINTGSTRHRRHKHSTSTDTGEDDSI